MLATIYNLNAILIICSITFIFIDRIVNERFTWLSMIGTLLFGLAVGMIFGAHFPNIIYPPQLSLK